MSDLNESERRELGDLLEKFAFAVTQTNRVFNGNTPMNLTDAMGEECRAGEAIAKFCERLKP